MVLLPRFAASRSLNLRHIKSFQTVSEEEFSETRKVREEPGLYHAVQTCLVLFPPRSAQESRYASPSLVIEYTQHPGPPSSGVSHSVLQSSSCSICLSVRYNVPAIFSANPSSTRRFISSYPRELSSCSVTRATGTSAAGLRGTGTSATGTKLFVGRISTSLLRSPLSHGVVALYFTMYVGVVSKERVPRARGWGQGCLYSLNRREGVFSETQRLIDKKSPFNNLFLNPQK